MRQVQGEALEVGRRRARGGQLGEPVVLDAVPVHRRRDLDDDAVPCRGRAGSAQRREACDRADGADHASVGLGGTGRSPGATG